MHFLLYLDQFCLLIVQTRIIACIYKFKETARERRDNYVYIKHFQIFKSVHPQAFPSTDLSIQFS